MGKKKQGKRKNLTKSLIAIGGLAFLILIWFSVSLILKSNGNNVLPYPHETLSRSIYFLFGESASRTWGNIGWTLLRLLIGYGISFLLAMVLGTLAGLFPYVKSFFSAGIGLFKVLPTAAVTIVLIGILFGPENRDIRVFIPSMLTFLVAFPVIYESFVKGMEEESRDINDALDLEGGHRRIASILKVHYPDSLPYITLALAQSLGLSLKVSIMSEVLTASGSNRLGIGGMIVIASQTGGVEDIMAYSLIAVFTMFLLDLPLFLIKYRRSGR